jgi:ribonuclease Z
MEEKAREHKHMTFYEAASMAKQAGVKELWLTHFSPSLSYPKNYEQAAREIFKNTHVAKDGRSILLAFEDED